MRRLLLTAALLLPMTAQAAPSFFTGNTLHSACSVAVGQSAANQMIYGECRGYIIGVSDAFLTKHDECAPSTVNTNQLIDLVSDYLEEFPQDRHYSAASIIEGVLEMTFDCDKEKTSFEVTQVHDDIIAEILHVTDKDWMQNSVYRPWPAEETEEEA
jgi:hypothetical protein